MIKKKKKIRSSGSEDFVDFCFGGDEMVISFSLS